MRMASKSGASRQRPGFRCRVSHFLYKPATTGGEICKHEQNELCHAVRRSVSDAYLLWSASTVDITWQASSKQLLHLVDDIDALSQTLETSLQDLEDKIQVITEESAELSRSLQATRAQIQLLQRRLTDLTNNYCTQRNLSTKTKCALIRQKEIVETKLADLKAENEEMHRLLGGWTVGSCETQAFDRPVRFMLRHPVPVDLGIASCIFHPVLPKLILFAVFAYVLWMKCCFHH